MISNTYQLGWKWLSSFIILTFLGASLLLSGCGDNNCLFGCPQTNGSGEGTGGSTGGDSGGTGGSNTAPTNCLGYVRTGVGNTATYSVTVNSGCDVIVQGVEGKNIGPYNWNNGAVAALGPGSYSFTITDGSYQMANSANAHAAYCNAIKWIQDNGKALSQVYPLAGWTDC